jgi:phage/plasmid-associated DNA primase
VFADLPSEKLRDNAIFKMLTTDRYIDAEEKFKNKFSFRNMVHQVYSANKLPDVTDPDEVAFFRRLICVTFPNSYVGTRADRTILERCTTEEEKSGFFNLAMIGLWYLIEQGVFCKNDSAEDIQKAYLIKANPIQSFLDECIEYSPDSLPKIDLYEAFVGWCTKKGITNIPKDNTFGRTLKGLGYVDYRETSGNRRLVWSNICINVKVDEETKNCQGSSGFVRLNKKTLTDFFKSTDNDNIPIRQGSIVKYLLIKGYDNKQDEDTQTFRP